MKDEGGKSEPQAQARGTHGPGDFYRPHRLPFDYIRRWDLLKQPGVPGLWVVRCRRGDTLYLGRLKHRDEGAERRKLTRAEYAKKQWQKVGERLA